MNRWSYSIANDQFGVNEYSPPTPTTPPQRVSEARSKTTPVAVGKTSYCSPGPAAPPFTYSRKLFQEYPTCPVNRPIASIRVRLEAPAKNGMSDGFEPFKSAQLPWASKPNTKAALCQR